MLVTVRVLSYGVEIMWLFLFELFKCNWRMFFMLFLSILIPDVSLGDNNYGRHKYPGSEDFL